MRRLISKMQGQISMPPRNLSKSLLRNSFLSRLLSSKAALESRF